MLHGSLAMIFEKTKKVRGVTIDDNPYNWKDILEAFDGVQRCRKEGLQVAGEIIKETALWLAIVRNGGKDKHWYFRGASHIALSCLKVIEPMVDDISENASESFLEPYRSEKIRLQVNEVQKFIKQIEALVFKKEVIKLHREIVSKLSFATEILNFGGQFQNL